MEVMGPLLEKMEMTYRLVSGLIQLSWKTGQTYDTRPHHYDPQMGSSYRSCLHMRVEISMECDVV